jgi:hypothetical protein
MDDPPTTTRRQAYREMIADGAPPAQVADVVYQAILDDQFFVFPTRPDVDRARRRYPPRLRWRDARFPGTT